MKKNLQGLLLILLSLVLSPTNGRGQHANELFEKLKKKFNAIDNYEADAVMKTNVSFLKVPQANVKVYFKKPTLIKIKNEQGISFVPKGIMNLSISSILNNNDFMVIDMTSEEQKKTGTFRTLKLLPVSNQNEELVLATLLVDVKELLIAKTEITTKENGTYQTTLTYGKYKNQGLPDRAVFSFNTKDYKLPKGITFDFDDGTNKKKSTEKKEGNIDITFKSYRINKGIPDNVFK